MTGAVVVGICDTGIDPERLDLIGRIGGCRAWDRRAAPVEHSGYANRREHGTAVAATVCAGAPDARLEVAVALDGGWVALRTLRGVNWLLTQPIDVLLLPFGLHPNTDLYEPLLRQAARLDIVVVAPAGNVGPGRLTSPGDSALVLSVGALAPDGRPELTSGVRVADGGTIVAPDVLATSRPEPCSPPGTPTGTSIAAAHVTAHAARIRARMPTATAGEVRDLIVDTAHHTDDADADTSRFGVIDRAARGLPGERDRWAPRPRKPPERVDQRALLLARWSSAPVPLLVRLDPCPSDARSMQDRLQERGARPRAVEPADSFGTYLVILGPECVQLVASRDDLELMWCADVSALPA